MQEKIRDKRFEKIKEDVELLTEPVGILSKMKSIIV